MQSLAVPRQHSSQPRCPSSNRAALDEDRERPIRLVTFTTLFPNDAEPNHGVFVENRLVRLVATGAATSTVLAPIPYFPALPLGARRFGRWSRLALAARREMRHGIAVHHPRYPVIPRAGMSVAPALLYAASARALSAMLASGQRFDAIDAHYLYPDRVVAVWLGRRFGLPVVVTARGSDVSQLPRYAVPRHLIRQAMVNADALVAVSAALKNAMLSLGAADERVTVLRNGVDSGQFRPADRSAARRELGLHGPTLLSVGHLIERKGYHRAIDAMRLLPGYTLLIAGEGPERARLEALIRKLGLTDRVRLLGARPHAALPRLYTAADALVLASSREGWANVLLESMACGTPVLASDVWGNPEVVRAPEAGLIYGPNTPDAIAGAVRRLFDALPARGATRRFAERYGWEETSAGQVELFRRVISDYRRTRPRGAQA